MRKEGTGSKGGIKYGDNLSASSEDRNVPLPLSWMLRL